MFSKIPTWILLVALLAVVLVSYEFSSHKVQTVPKHEVTTVTQSPPEPPKVDVKKEDSTPAPVLPPVVQQDVPQTNESPKAVDDTPVTKKVVVKKPKVAKKDPPTTPVVTPQDPFSTFIGDIFNIH